MSEEIIDQAEQPVEEGANQEEQPTSQEPTQDESEAEETGEETEEQRETEKKPWYKKRFDELTAKRYEAERRAERLEQMLHEMYSKGQPAQQQEQKPVGAEFQPTRPKPTRESVDFDDDAYIEAVTDWKVEQAEAKRQHQESLQRQKRQQEEQYQTFEQKRVAVVDAGRKAHDDFEAVVFSLPGDIMTAELAQAIFETEAPHEVSYYLGKRPQEAARISALPPVKKAIELGKIEARLSNPIKRDTNAPPPPTPIGGKGPTEKDPDKMTTAEWMAWREAQVRQKSN